MKQRLIELQPNETAKVCRLEGGFRFQHRLKTRGILPGKKLKVVIKQPRGPVVVNVGGRQLSIGKGMAARVIVERV